MRKLLLYIAVTFVVISHTSAQVRIGILGGASNYQGDLVDQPYKSTYGVIGGTLSYEFSDRFSLRGGLAYAKVGAADSLSNHPDLRLRNLSFQSRIYEMSLIGEFTFFNMNDTRWSPYVFAGIAVYHFSPYTYDRNHNRVYLQPLSTEGEGIPGYNIKPYKLNQFAIPFGGGIKYALSEKVNIGLEIGLRKLFTDYLDDVSGNYVDAADLLAAKGPKAVELAYRGDEVPGGNPAYPAKGAQRGSPKYNDYYYFTTLHISFLLFGNRETSWRNSGALGAPGRKKGYGCPRNPL